MLLNERLTVPDLVRYCISELHDGMKRRSGEVPNEGTGVLQFLSIFLCVYQLNGIYLRHVQNVFCLCVAES